MRNENPNKSADKIALSVLCNYNRITIEKVTVHGLHQQHQITYICNLE